MKNTNKYLTLGLAITLLTGGASKGEIVKFESQLDALTQLNNGTVEVAIIDSVMAGYYTSNGEFKEKLAIVDNLILASEQYGIAAKKGNSSLIQNINYTLYSLFENNQYQDIAAKYNLKSTDYALSSNAEYTVTATDNSYSNIVTNQKVVIGYTVFAPIAYTDTTTNKLTGFDVDLANKVFETLDSNIDVEWLIIDWSAKEALLESGTIDLIWNGLTITEQRQENMEISIPYLNNNQVAVTLKDKVASYDSKDKLKTAIIGVEDGSAGLDAAEELLK